MLITAVIDWWTRRDFAREWADSLRVKRRAPLGEDTLARRLGEPSRGAGVARGAAARLSSVTRSS
jgi:putative membrane protein